MINSERERKVLKGQEHLHMQIESLTLLPAVEKTRHSTFKTSSGTDTRVKIQLQRNGHDIFENGNFATSSGSKLSSLRRSKGAFFSNRQQWGRF